MTRRRKRLDLQLPRLGPLWWVCALLVVIAMGWVTLEAWRKTQPDVGDYSAMIEEHAEATGLSPALIRAVIQTESSGDPLAHSSADARGLMQITPITHREVNRQKGLPPPEDEDVLFDPEYNIAVGTFYLSYLLERFDGDTRLALAAYHMGPTDLSKLIRQHPTLNTEQILALNGPNQVGPKTRAYVENVMARAE